MKFLSATRLSAVVQQDTRVPTPHRELGILLSRLAPWSRLLLRLAPRSLPGGQSAPWQMARTSSPHFYYRRTRQKVTQELALFVRNLRLAYFCHTFLSSKSIRRGSRVPLPGQTGIERRACRMPMHRFRSSPWIAHGGQAYAQNSLTFRANPARIQLSAPVAYSFYRSRSMRSSRIGR